MLGANLPLPGMICPNKTHWNHVQLGHRKEVYLIGLSGNNLYH